MAGPLVMVGMSGGVDSSVAALLLRRAGTPIAGAVHHSQILFFRRASSM